MRELDKPILHVESLRADSIPKKGSGRTPDPLVKVTPALIQKLDGQLAAAIKALPRDAVDGATPVAVKVKLRERALAKSQRPQTFLAQANLKPVGARQIGELIVPATAARLARLQKNLRRTSATARHAISTFETFGAWGVDDVFPYEPQRRREVISQALSDGRTFRVEFFPWAPKQEGEARNLLSRTGNGYEVVRWISHETRPFGYVRIANVDAVLRLASLPEVRHVVPTPIYSVPTDIGTQGFRLLEDRSPQPIVTGSDVDEIPVVGVIDSGVESTLMEQWVTGSEVYELPPDTDYIHGTFVAGLVAGSKAFNDDDPRFPQDNARVLDIRALPRGPIEESLLLERIEEVVAKYSDVRVWNCSFAAANPNYPPTFGAFAQRLDELSDKYKVMFVQAAGNFSSKPLRTWPTAGSEYPRDGIAMPSEAARGLAVGSVAHYDGAVAVDCPTPYSRRGPGPAFTVKPEVVHYGGSLDTTGQLNASGVKSLVPGDLIAESLGTSFSTPIVSAIAANTWRTLEKSWTGDVRPELVKGLLVHAAALDGGDRTDHERQYYGYGLVPNSLATLFCDPHAFTLLFEAELAQGLDWHKTPYPIPRCLLTPTGHLRAEVVMTVSYAPPLDPSFADEYLQHEVTASFGSYELDSETGRWEHKSRVPLDRPVGASTREKALIEEAFKWCPTKVHRKRFPRGTAADQWRLMLSLTRRKEIESDEKQRAYVIVTLRGFESDLPVYIDGLRAVQSANWITQPIAAEAHVRIVN